MYQYSMIFERNDVTGLFPKSFAEQWKVVGEHMTDLEQRIHEMITERPPGDWEPVSHSISTIGDILVTSVLIRRQSQ